MPKYEVGIFWNCFGTIEVEATSPEEAQDKAYDMVHDNDFAPTGGTYESWSADVDWDLEPTELES